MANLTKTPEQKNTEKLIKAYKENQLMLANETIKYADSGTDWEYDTLESMQRLKNLNYALYQTFLHRNELIRDVQKYYREDIIKGKDEKLLERRDLLIDVINLALICRLEIISFDRQYDCGICDLRNYVDNPPEE